MVTMRRGFLMLSFAIALCIITVTGCGNNPEQGKSQEEGSTEVTKNYRLLTLKITNKYYWIMTHVQSHFQE